MKKLALLASVLLLLSPLAKAGEVSPTEFWQMAGNPDSVIVDVRTSGEFSSGHIEKALNIPYEQIARLGDVVADKSAPILLYCRSGRRADVAEQTLRGMGYTNISNGMSYNLLMLKSRSDASSKIKMPG